MSPELTSLEPRIVIIGNSGSGKSMLARLLESRVGGERTDLDCIHWLDKVGVKRDEGEANELVAALAVKPNWIIESVYGWLAEAALPRATALIWLDMSPEVCRDSLALRGPWRGATAEEHADFLAWAEAYWLRKRRVRSLAIWRCSTLRRRQTTPDIARRCRPVRGDHGGLGDELMFYTSLKISHI
jgi:adenylate kinase family enzyme